MSPLEAFSGLFWHIGSIVAVVGAFMVVAYVMASRLARRRHKVLAITSVTVLGAGIASLAVSALYHLVYRFLMLSVPP